MGEPHRFGDLRIQWFIHYVLRMAVLQAGREVWKGESRRESVDGRKVWEQQETRP